MWIEGEPGIGKSAVLQAAESLVGSARVRVFTGAGDELTELFELRLMADCLRVDTASADARRAEIAHLLAGRRGGINAVSAASIQIEELIDEECAHSPVLLAIDDLQWSDAASLAVWRRLAALTQQLPLVVLGACRPVPLRADLDAVRRALANQPNATHIHLRDLTLEEVAQMAATLLSAEPGPQLVHILSQAAGNPLYVREIVDALVRDRAIVVFAGVAELGGTGGHELSSLSGAITRRLAFLAEPIRVVLRAAAALDSRFTLPDLSLVSNRSMPELQEIVGHALAAGVLVEAGPELMFRHPLIRKSLYDELPAALQTGLHAHAAQQLAARGASWEKVGQHLVAAPGRFDDWAIDWLTALPAAALYARPAIAADVLERAREATPPGDPRRGSLATRLTTVLRLLGREETLITLASEVLPQLTDADHIGEVAWNLATGLHMAGRFEEQDAVIIEVLANRSPGRPWRSRIRALRGPGLYFRDQREEAIRQSELAIAEGEADRDPLTVGRALAGLYSVATDHTDELAYLDRALAVVTADDAESADLRHLLMRQRLIVLTNSYQIAEYDRSLRQVLPQLERLGGPRLWQVQLSAAEHYLDCGDWDQAELFLDQMSDGGDNTRGRLKFHGLRAYMAACRGDRAEAKKQIAAVADINYTEAFLRFIARRLISARALLAEAEQRHDEALELLAGWLDPQFERRSGWFRPQILRELVRVALSADDRNMAQVAATEAMADASASGDECDRVEAQSCQAMLDDDPAPLLVAARFMADGGQAEEQASLLQEATVRLAMAADTETRARLGETTRLYSAMGNILELGRLRARLRPYGIRPGPQSLHRRATTGWEALTPTELSIVDHIVAGESNADIAAALFLSRRTVETHVSHVLTKLQVQSRIDIARIANQQRARE